MSTRKSARKAEPTGDVGRAMPDQASFNSAGAERVEPERVGPDTKGTLPTYGVEGVDQHAGTLGSEPRVTLHHIRKRIVNETFYKHDHLTICVLEVENGFFVVGKAAPVSIGNFDADTGVQNAYEDAIRQMFQLEGYLLREKLHREQGTF